MPLQRNLIRVEVYGLFDQFDHRFDFDKTWDFCILYGDNGIGKTRMLEIVRAALTFDVLALGSMPFKRAVLLFDDKTELTAYPGSSKDSNTDSQFDVDLPMGRVELTTPRSRETFTWPESSPEETRDFRYIRRVMRDAPVVPEGTNTWMDMNSEEILSTQEAFRRYGSKNFGKPGRTAPSPVREFSNATQAHLVETQRLLGERSNERVMRKYSSGPRHEKRVSTASGYASDLVERIQQATLQNSRTSQKLDRSFPKRVLESGELTGTSDEELRRHYNEQRSTRNRLADVALVDRSADDFPLPEHDLQPWERRVLSTYLRDVDKKLATYSDLLAKLELFRDIINDRFRFKKMTIDSKKGFVFHAGSKEIGPDQLSSGEQHELVITYDLLFQVEQGSLVMVDEPEISLHVAWQQQFISDVRRIAKLTGIRFVIATHSPQIIHTWHDRAISLSAREYEGHT